MRSTCICQLSHHVFCACSCGHCCSNTAHSGLTHLHLVRESLPYVVFFQGINHTCISRLQVQNKLHLFIFRCLHCHVSLVPYLSSLLEIECDRRAFVSFRIFSFVLVAAATVAQILRTVASLTCTSFGIPCHLFDHGRMLSIRCSGTQQTIDRRTN